jgi:replicative DNA helicase
MDFVDYDIESYFINDFEFDTTPNRVDERVFKTGFSNLDGGLGGGLRAGSLYIVGAPPAEGKTTFALQMAWQMVEQDYAKCAFFSLEMSKKELAARLMSHILYKESMGKIKLCEAEILDGNYTDEHLGIVRNTMHETGYRLELHECNLDYDVSRIIDAVTNDKGEVSHEVVFIDYLQVLALAIKTGDMRRKVDLTLTELKRMARDLNIAVVLISNVSRMGQKAIDDGYISFGIFKESSQIEYTADALLAMYTRSTRCADHRVVGLKCLKNRKGPNFQLSYRYKPEWNIFDTERVIKFDS